MEPVTWAQATELGGPRRVIFPFLNLRYVICKMGTAVYCCGE